MNNNLNVMNGKGTIDNGMVYQDLGYIISQIKTQLSLFCFLVLISILSANLTVAQAQSNYQNVVPPSAEVAAFAKYADIPMAYSSGTPIIDIPLTTLKSGPLDLSLSLTYNASGIRVEEVPTWVGLGWNLGAGPTLSRVVRGLPDDFSPYGYMYSGTNRTVKYVAGLDPQGSERSYIELQLLPNGFIDLEPDIFSFSVLGYSGNFYYNQDSAKFILTPFQNIKIANFNNGDGISSFVLTLPNGVQCVFGGTANALEKRQSGTTTVLTNTNGSATTSQNNDNNPTYIGNWAITSIVDPTGKMITYSYILANITEFGRGGENYTPNDGGSNTSVYSASFTKSFFLKPILQNIHSELSDVYFNLSATDRLDMLPGAKALDNITVYNNGGILCKKFVFGYDYTISIDNVSLWGLSDCAAPAQRRLVLKTVQETNGKGTLSMPPYRFAYNGVPLPSRLSASQDYWGYYNGKENGLLLMPRIPNRVNPGLPEGYYVEFPADRRIDEAYAVAGSISEIGYPTGGTIAYSYEPNKVMSSYFDPNGGLERPDLVDKSFNYFPLMIAGSPYPRVYSAFFAITRPATKVKITPTLPAPCSVAFDDASCLYTIKIKNSLGTVLYQSRQNQSVYIPLDEGSYIIEVTVAGTENDPVTPFAVLFNWGENPEQDNFKIGGLRVNKVVSTDSVTGSSIIKTFDYNYPSSGTSSGVLGGYPTHIVKTYAPNGTYLRYALVSNSPIPLTTDGLTVRYQSVSEYYNDDKSSFKTEYGYLSDFPAFVFGKNDGAPPLQLGWRNNILARKKQFEKTTGNIYRMLSDVENNYTSFMPLQHVYGLSGSGLLPYMVATEWYLMDSTTSVSHSYPNDIDQSLLLGTKYSYNNNFMISNTRTVNSKGQLVENKAWYTYDYNDVSGFNITTLANNFIYSPIKQETTVNGKAVSGNIINYNAMGQPIKLYNFESAVPLASTAHDANTVLEPNYALNTTLSYGVDNNLQQAVTHNGAHETYLWGYNSQYPVAKVVGSDYNTVSGLVSQSALDNAVGGSDDDAVRSALAPLRGITGALATTYTYLPLVGVTSQTDPAGRTTYYEYDGLQRLYLVRDQDKNILKRYCYSYANQVGGSCPASIATRIPDVVLGGSGYCSDTWGYPFTYLFKDPTSHCVASKKLENQTVKHYTSSVLIPSTGNYLCTYHYEFSNGDHSWDLTEISANSSCTGTPLPCDTSGCSEATGHRCIAGQCLPGQKIYTASAFDSSGGSWHWTCTYHYEYPSGPHSADMAETSATSCLGNHPACDTTACSAVEGHKCIFGNCELGTRVNTDTWYYQMGNIPDGDTGPTGWWYCTYHYEWSDGTSSPDLEDTNPDPCVSQTCCGGPINPYNP